MMFEPLGGTTFKQEEVHGLVVGESETSGATCGIHDETCEAWEVPVIHVQNQ